MSPLQFMSSPTTTLSPPLPPPPGAACCCCCWAAPASPPVAPPSTATVAALAAALACAAATALEGGDFAASKTPFHLFKISRARFFKLESIGGSVLRSSFKVFPILVNCVWGCVRACGVYSGWQMQGGGAVQGGGAGAGCNIQKVVNIGGVRYWLHGQRKKQCAPTCVCTAWFGGEILDTRSSDQRIGRRRGRE